jgi:hypothetical protein
VPLRVIPERSELAEHLIQSARAKGADVLDDRVRGRHSSMRRRYSLQSPDRSPASPAPLPAVLMSWQGNPPAITSTGPTSKACRSRTSLEAGHVRPVLAEHGAAVGVDFAEGDGSHPGSLEPETESADAGEEVEDTFASGTRSTRRRFRRCFANWSRLVCACGCVRRDASSRRTASRSGLGSRWRPAAASPRRGAAPRAAPSPGASYAAQEWVTTVMDSPGVRPSGLLYPRSLRLAMCPFRNWCSA